MSIVEKLLQIDSGKLQKPVQKVKIPRLSEVLGEEVYFTCTAIDAETYADIQKLTLDINDGELRDIDILEMQMLTVIEGTIEPNFKDEKLLKHFGCATAKNLVKKLLLPGEISALYNVISDLSGFNIKVDDIKNSSTKTQK